VEANAMSTLTLRARRYLGDAVRGFEHAPLEVALVLYVAVTWSYAIEQTAGDAMPNWLEMTVDALLVLAFAWTGTMLQALGVWSGRTRWIVTAVGALVVSAFARMDFVTLAEGWRAAGLVTAAVLWLVALPAFSDRAAPVERMRQVDGRILLRLVAAGLYGAALFAGLALALAAIDTLFELNLEGQIYGHVFGWIFIVLVPLVVFGGLADYVRPDGGPNAVGRAVQRLLAWLVPPLLALYFLILYAYLVRIAITAEVPKNLVSPLVLAACVLTALALLFFDPHPRTTWFDRALRLSPPLLLPLAPLGAWALFVRIEQYGWTEFRAIRLVVLAAFTALAAVATVQLWRRRPFALHVMPVTLAVVALLSVLGPWSVFPLSRHSQQRRLAAALARVEQIPFDTAAPPPAVAPAPRPTPIVLGPGELPPEASTGPKRTVPAELFDQVQTDARYLLTHFGPAALPASLARFVSADQTSRIDFAGRLGLRRAPGTGEQAETAYRRLAADVPVPVRGGLLYRIDYRLVEESTPNRPVQVSADSLLLRIRLPAGVMTADLAPLLETPSGGEGELPPTASVLPVRDAAGQDRGELVVLELSVGPQDGRRVLRRVLGTLMLPDTTS